MGLWSRLFGRRRTAESATSHGAAAAAPGGESGVAGREAPIELPAEPFVFECQSCGKVFEARRLRPLCPECDSSAVSLLSGE
jgi:hypothetical protein